MLSNDIRNFFGGLSSVEDEQLEIYIKDAEARVIDDGVPKTHNKFTLLVRYALGALLIIGPGTGQLQGLGASSATAIKKETVGDVSVDYKDQGIDTTGGGRIKDLPGGGYESEYLRILTSIIGLGHIVV